MKQAIWKGIRIWCASNILFRNAGCQNCAMSDIVCNVFKVLREDYVKLIMLYSIKLSTKCKDNVVTYLNMNGLRKCFFLFSVDVPWGCAAGEPQERKAWESRPSCFHIEILWKEFFQWLQGHRPRKKSFKIRGGSQRILRIMSLRRKQIYCNSMLKKLVCWVVNRRLLSWEL